MQAPSSGPELLNTLPSIKNIHPPSSIQEWREMLELGRKLVVTAVEYQNSCLTRKEMVQIKTCLDSLVWKIA